MLFANHAIAPARVGRPDGASVMANLFALLTIVVIISRGAGAP